MNDHGNNSVLDGHRLAHDVVGKRDGPRLVLIHGFASNRSWFAPLADAWASRGSSVAVDLRGHGDSDDNGARLTYEALAQDVAGLLRQLGWCARDTSRNRNRDSVVAIGHSMGGAVALELAANHPSLVDAVVLLDPLPVVMTPATRSVFELLGSRFGADDRNDALRSMVRANILDTDEVTEEQIDAIVTACCQTSGHVLASTAAAFAEWDGEATASRCPRPVLHVSAAASRPELGGAATQLTRAVAVANRYPEWQFGQVVAAGHLAMLRDSAQIATMLERFLSCCRLLPSN